MAVQLVPKDSERYSLLLERLWELTSQEPAQPFANRTNVTEYGRGDGSRQSKIYVDYKESATDFLTIEERGKSTCEERRSLIWEK